MLRRTSLYLGAVWTLALVFAVGAHAEIGIDRDFSGRVNVESRWFPQAGAFSGQGAHAIGFLWNPNSILQTLRVEASRYRRSFATTMRTHAAPMPICAKPIF